MKKQIFSLLMVSTFLLGCAFNCKGSYTKRIFKTTNNKVIVTGIIYGGDKNNNPIAGGIIKSADTTFLTSADRDGKYRIELTEGKHILSATYIGFNLTSTKYLNLVKGDSLVLDFILKDSREKTSN